MCQDWPRSWGRAGAGAGTGDRAGARTAAGAEARMGDAGDAYRAGLGPGVGVGMWMRLLWKANPRVGL